jgi:hypothetical protein
MHKIHPQTDLLIHGSKNLRQPNNEMFWRNVKKIAQRELKKRQVNKSTTETANKKNKANLILLVLFWNINKRKYSW